MRTPTAAVLVVSLALAGAARAADTPPPGGIPDLTGARTLGLSAAIGTPSGNDGIYLNPGAIAARRRYAIEGGVLLDRRGSETVDRFLGISVVDSVTTPVTAGVSYQRAQEGVYEGNVMHLALAGPAADKFFVGASGKYFSLSGPRPVRAATADAGILWQAADLVSIGITGYNLVPVSNYAVAPMGAGAGIAIGSDRNFQITADWRADFDRRAQTANRWAAGAEGLVGRMFPLRAGWMKDEVLDTSWWSIGGGIVSQSGIALDIGYRQAIEDPSARTFAATLKFFVKT